MKAGIIITDGKQMLVCTSDNYEGNDHDWDIPKGTVEKNEQPMTAAVRELYEETGIELDESELRTFGAKRFKSFTGKDEVFCIYYYLCDDLPDTASMHATVTFDWYEDETGEPVKYKRINGIDDIDINVYEATVEECINAGYKEIQLPEMSRYKYIPIKDCQRYLPHSYFFIFDPKIILERFNNVYLEEFLASLD